MEDGWKAKSKHGYQLRGNVQLVCHPHLGLKLFCLLFLHHGTECFGKVALNLDCFEQASQAL